MSKRKPKTKGLEWLYLSLASFNGSGYADKATPENYVASYRAYKVWKKDNRAVQILDENLEFAFEQAARLCLAREPGHTPNEKNYSKFLKHYNPDNLELFQ